MSLDCGWLLARLAVLLCLLAFIIQSVVSVLYFTGESSSLSGSEQFHHLLGGKGVDLFRGVSSKRVLLEALLFLLYCGHCLWIIQLNLYDFLFF